jgi:hypothetical protein
MTQELVEYQKPNGREWEQRIIARILKLTVYIPKGTLDANKIQAVNKTTLISYIEAEGYGK